MGLAVHIPDALCLRLATVLAGHGAFQYPLAWGLHVLTAGLIGCAFGALASLIPIRGKRAVDQALLGGLSTGVVVWAGFFAPLMLTFLPQLVTSGLLESSFIAHLLLGIVLGLTLIVTLKWADRAPRAA